MLAPDDSFASAVEAFGPLPADAQRELSQDIGFAFFSSGLARANLTAWPAGEHRDRMKEIKNTTNRLLRLLDIGSTDLSAAKGEWVDLPAALGPLMLAMTKTTTARRQQTPPGQRPCLSGHHMPLMSLILLLADFFCAAGDVESDQAARVKPGKGGKRRAGPGAGETFLSGLFGIYDQMRRRFPDSGPTIGFGGSLVRFVSAAHQDAGIDVAGDVKSSFTRWSNSKRKLD